jgi:cephalosporin-C deacetylase-like acetyl esterase
VKASNRRWPVIVAGLGLLLASFLAGVADVMFNLPPYPTILALYRSVHPARATPEAFYTAQNPLWSQTDPAWLLHVRNAAEATGMSQFVVRTIWGIDQLPVLAPTVVERDVAESSITRLPGVRSVDRITHVMPHGVDSRMYLVHPVVGNGDLMLVHSGHDGDAREWSTAIRFFVERGYAVLAISMPLYGPNSRPVVTIPSVGALRLETHDMFALLAYDLNPLRYFVEPIVAAINYLNAQGAYDRIGMMGLSGGGWTTTLYAAIDRRVTRSYPVAGSLPHHLKTTLTQDGWVFAGTGDYEQTLPSLHPRISYLDLYVLGSLGPSRRQIQILNKYDPCCYSGTAYTQYESVVSSRVSEISADSSFKVFLDETIRTHDVSPAALALIDADFRDQ